MPKKDKGKLRIIPLGGLNEIGKNMTVLEYGEDIIIIDCGRVVEWSKAQHWKCCVWATAPWVRIPPLPPFFLPWSSIKRIWI